jgi:hypothetical protein
MRNITYNKEKIKKQIQDIDTTVEYFKNEFNLDVANINSETRIFHALDDMKANLQNATITVTSFEDSESSKPIPIKIKASMKNYSMLVRYFQYVESFRIPRYKIIRFSVKKGASGAMMLDLKGEFMMPSL